MVTDQDYEFYEVLATYINEKKGEDHIYNWTILGGNLLQDKKKKIVMYVIPHISNRILDFFWELPPDRSHSDTVGRVANKVRVEGGFRNISLLTHVLSQRFLQYFDFLFFTHQNHISSHCVSHLRYCSRCIDNMFDVHYLLLRYMRLFGAHFCFWRESRRHVSLRFPLHWIRRS